MDLMLNQIHFATFVPFINENFEIKAMGTDQWVTSELVEVKDMSRPGQEIFSIIFRTSSEHYLGQGTHLVRHPRVGEVGLFMVPIIMGIGGGDFVHYQAIFNRLV
ncbi:MAG: hypothetical protein GY737_05585 [Desulfobacteraceae bacterium]|nr:hypothetical protein [Desulfobacteraceae bacterium]